jgi:hypothetical protein
MNTFLHAFVFSRPNMITASLSLNEYSVQARRPRSKRQHKLLKRGARWWRHVRFEPQLSVVSPLTRPMRCTPTRCMPACRFYSWVPKYRSTVGSHRNGNFGGPYYVCIRCKSFRQQTQCAHVSVALGLEYWTCATGACGYYSEFKNKLIQGSLI